MSLVKTFREVEDAYHDEQQNYVEKVIEITSTYHPRIENVSTLIAQLDVLTAFASVAEQYSYSKPEVVESRTLDLIESRHPLIEVADPASCISNSCIMEQGQSNLAVITGPNMGGKSTYIR
jgi:DNA mismatch repair ATPase MutS